MTTFPPRLRAFSAALLASALLLPTVPAKAENIFGRLFGGGIRHADEFPEAPPAPRAQQSAQIQKTAARKAAPKISAPSYYDYRPDALVAVDFTGLPATTQTASLAAMPTRDTFHAALSGLDGYDLRAEKDIAAALIYHYGRDGGFVFSDGVHPNEKARAVMALLADAGRYGLDPADYAVALPAQDFAFTETPRRAGEMIRFEMALAARALRYAHDAYQGRITPNRISGYHDFAPKPFDAARLLAALAAASDAPAILAAQHPQNPEYKALVAELAALETSPEQSIAVDPKTVVKPGETNPEFGKIVALIRARGEIAPDKMSLLDPAQGDVYAEALVPAVKAQQEKLGLKPDGVIGPRTVEALAGLSKADRIAKVVVALEQLRWMPSDLGQERVFINQPAFTATYRKDGVDTLSMRVVIGTPANQTSFFQDEIEQVDFNPYWGVPQSILVNEMLPRLRDDPGYLDRAGYEVFDGKGKRIPSSAVAWGQYGAKVPYSVRQTPSEANALGELKILFPNKHAIYMHDTPQKALFARDTRAFSHGCVRLADPRAMAAAVLGKPVDYVAAKLAKGHSAERVNRRIPVYVAYFTAWPDQAGKVSYFGDVYGRDDRMATALEKTSKSRVAPLILGQVAATDVTAE